MGERKITFSKRDDAHRFGYVNAETGVYIRRNRITHMGWVVIKPTRHDGQLQDCVATLAMARRVATNTVREVRAEIAAAYVEAADAHSSAAWEAATQGLPRVPAFTAPRSAKSLAQMSHGERTALMYRAALRRHSAPSN